MAEKIGFNATGAAKNLYQACRWLELNNIEVLKISWNKGEPKIMIANNNLTPKSTNETHRFIELYGCRVGWENN